MKRKMISGALAGLLSWASHAQALTAHPSDSGLVAADALSLRATRLSTTSVPARASVAWQRFRADVGGEWLATWDEATGVPLRIFGEGIAAANASGSPQAAESFARSFLARHRELLAPGSSALDFVLAANEVLTTPGGELRVVSFRQSHGGLDVEGGQLSFRFKRDRLIVLASEALPNVRGRRPPRSIDDNEARLAAEDLVRSRFASIASATELGDARILPLIGAARVHRFVTVVPVTVRASAPLGLYTVFLDAASGAPVALRQELRFGEATIHIDAPVRRPTAERQPYPAPLLEVFVDGKATTASELGAFDVPDGMASAIAFTAKGSKISVANKAGKAEAASLTLEPGKDFLWSAPDKPFADSQLASYVHAHIAKAHGRTIAPSMKWLDAFLQVNVNIDDACNAFYDGQSINFFRQAGPCENTGRLADVVYHEFGHGFHHHAIVFGAGNFDPALSEGLSDYYATSLTGDPGMGRGFFYDDEPLRDIDPQGEALWPEHVSSDPHETGLIIAGALWDLRKLLVEKHGEDAGKQLNNELFYAAARTSADIPSSFPEVLAADDDDGNLANGTPNVCEIIDAFGRHGLRTVDANVLVPSAAPPTQDGYDVAIHVGGLYQACASDTVAEVSLRYRREGDNSALTSVAMTGGPADYAGQIPTQDDGTVVRFRVEVELASGGALSYPDNLADRLYQLHVGDVEPIYCTDFEADPFSGGWTHGLSQGTNEDGADDWQWGMPTSEPASGDPESAFSGARVFGNDLGHGVHTGSYQPEKVNFALSPSIDVRGYTDVRLQYRRWLTVEDGYYDAATIYVNGKYAWGNYSSGSENEAEIHHRDREWRFHDLPLTPYLEPTGQLSVKFELASDMGYELGGWTIDDFCVVGRKAEVTVAVCGDGELEEAEACDDGNVEAGDGCDASCAVEGEPKRRPQRTIVITSGCGCLVAGGDATPSDGRALRLAALCGVGLALLRRRRSRNGKNAPGEDHYFTTRR